MIFVITLIVIAWVCCGFAALIVAASIDREAGESLKKQIEKHVDHSDFVPSLLLMCLFGPLSVLAMLCIWAIFSFPEISLDRILAYIPLKIAELIDCLFIKPGGDNER